MKKDKASIALLDDHKVVTDGLKMVLDLEPDFKVIHVATTGVELLSKLVSEHCDVVIIDFSLGDKEETGLDIARIILEQFKDTKVLMLSMHDSAEVIAPCIECGVHGYALKSEKEFDPVKSVRKIIDCGFYFSPELTATLAFKIAEFNSTKVVISDREFEVLKTIFKGFTSKEAAELLFISPYTVETHRKRIIEKFNAKNSVHMIYLALKQGILKV